MTIYYIDSVNGSNSNTGTSETSAFKSVDVVANLKLRPGDSILLARGSVFIDTLTLTKSGTDGNPITVGAYGTGESPTFSGNIGIFGTKTANIVVKDVAFANSTGAAIYGNNVTNWTIDNITVSDTGNVSGIGGIFFKRGVNVSVTNSSFDGVNGDGVFVQWIDGLKIENNSFTGLRGAAADGIQVTESSNIVVSHNFIDQTTSPDSTKGGIVANDVQNIIMNDNVIKGGSFGMSINGNHVVLDGNKFSGQDKYSWSASILIGGNWDLTDYQITDNSFSDSLYGVSITGLRTDQVTRTDIDINNNVFENMAKAALKIDKSATGTFDNNTIINSEVSLIKGEGLTNVYDINSNIILTSEQAAALAHPPVPEPVVSKPAVSVPVVTQPVINIAPVAAIDLVSLSSSSKTVSGNILANDIDENGDTLLVRTVGSGKVGTNGADIVGLYGTLHVETNGDFVYQMNDGAVALLKNSTKMVEKFQYKISDTIAVDTSSLIIDLSSYVQSHAHDQLLI